MKTKIAYSLILVFLSSFAFANNEIKKTEEDSSFYYFCIEDAIGIYDATLATTGDRGRALDNAMAFYDICMQE